MALEPKTGKILVELSKPDFDPNTIAQNWESLVNDADNSCLLNRATNGAYPPDANEDFGFEVDLPKSCTSRTTTSAIYCPNNDVYDLLDYGQPSVFGGNRKAKVGYTIWLQNSNQPGLHQCVAVTADKVANSVCKSMGGIPSNKQTATYSKTALGGDTTSYDLP